MSSEAIALQAVWNLRSPTRVQYDIRDSVLDRSIFSNCTANIEQMFTVIETTPGPLRKPPNLHPSILYLSNDNAVSLSETPPATSKHPHPTILNLSMIKNVLSPTECRAIIAATEKVGFTPDAPVRQDGEDSSVLAHNVYWVVDEAFHDKLWERVRSHVPEQVGGKMVRGINRRFRVYRYVPGAEYRCHIGSSKLYQS
jgi:hypothetical protein